MVAALSAAPVYAREDDGPRCFAHILDPGRGRGREAGRAGVYCSKLTSTAAYMLMNREVGQEGKEGGREGGREGGEGGKEGGREEREGRKGGKAVMIVFPMEEIATI
jgi:hypothetical protein